MSNMTMSIRNNVYIELLNYINKPVCLYICTITLCIVTILARLCCCCCILLQNIDIYGFGLLKIGYIHFGWLSLNFCCE